MECEPEAAYTNLAGAPLVKDPFEVITSAAVAEKLGEREDIARKDRRQTGLGSSRSLSRGSEISGGKSIT